jgi:hypothetical protein
VNAGTFQRLADGFVASGQVDPVHLGPRRYHGAGHAVAQPHHAGDHPAFFRFDNPGAFCFGNNGFDFLVGHAAACRNVLSEQAQQGAAGNVEHPDQRLADFREGGHRRSDARRNPLGIAQGDLLGHQFADDQRRIGDQGDDHNHAGRVGNEARYSDVGQKRGQSQTERCAGHGAGHNPDQSDADLDRRQQPAGIGRQRQRAA